MGLFALNVRLKISLLRNEFLLLKIICQVPTLMV